MSQSAGAVTEVPPLAGSLRHSKSNRAYRVLERDGRWFQQRYRPGPQGREDYIYEEAITHFIGSGSHARTYLHQSAAGELSQLPLTYYTLSGHWGMSPGYDRPRHYDFGRAIDPNCLFCHSASAAEPAPIGCARCHGPGERHAELARTGVPVGDLRTAIVNPKRLDFERRMDVCLQCHLQTINDRKPHALERDGKRLWDFRPGGRLDDYLVHFDHAPSAGGGRNFDINSHGYRLLQSRCFQRSGQRLSCTTCHDPHRTPQGVAARAGFNAACQGCHRPHESAGGNDCVACHMPRRRTHDAVHVVMTDHAIPRHLPADPLSPLEEQEPPDRPLIVYRPASLSAARQAAYVRRATDPPPKPPGVLENALDRIRSGDHAAAIDLLERAARHVATRAEALNNLGNLYAELGELDKARDALTRALAFDPDFAEAHNNIGKVHAAEGRLEEALRSIGAALTLSPDYPEAHFNLARLLEARGDRQTALSHYRAALRLKADFPAARQAVERLTGQP